MLKIEIILALNFSDVVFIQLINVKMPTKDVSEPHPVTKNSEFQSKVI